MTACRANQTLAIVAAAIVGTVGGFTGLAEPTKAAQAPATHPGPPASSDWHISVRDFAARHFKNPAWGYSHCMRDYSLARELAAADHVTLDDDVLFAAAYLHDMALYLHDADALDWLGAIGVARIMALVDPNGGDPDGPKAVKMLEDNLKDVPPRVLSPAGRAMAAPRQAELRQFLENLRRESDNLHTL